MKPLTIALFLLLVFTNVYPVYAQKPKLSLYLDCDCDRTYMRQEISFVNHVRDQDLADIHLFITDIETGGGGRMYDLQFKGRRTYRSLSNSGSYQTQTTYTSDEIRRGLAEKIMLGLIPYLVEADVDSSFQPLDAKMAQRIPVDNKEEQETISHHIHE